MNLVLRLRVKRNIKLASVGHEKRRWLGRSVVLGKLPSAKSKLKRSGKRVRSPILEYWASRLSRQLPERREAEKRQKAKKADKKGQAEASRKKAENALRTQQERAQNLRSATFTAARAGDSEKVKKGVWEDNVDATGGEVKKGSEEFVTAAPADPKETLLHIAVKNGDGELVEWLDSHSKMIMHLSGTICAELKSSSRRRPRGTQLAGFNAIPSCCSTWTCANYSKAVL